MQITTGNYFSEIQGIAFDTLDWPGKEEDPTVLQAGDEFVRKATKNGKTWQAYKQSESIRKIIDDYLVTLNMAIQGSKDQDQPKGRVSRQTGKETSTGKKEPEKKPEREAHLKTTSGFSYEVDPLDVDDRVKVEWDAQKSIKVDGGITAKLVGFNSKGRPVYQDVDGWRYKPDIAHEARFSREAMLIMPGSFGDPSTDPGKREMDVRLAFPPNRPSGKKTTTNPTANNKAAAKTRSSRKGKSVVRSRKAATPVSRSKTKKAPKVVRELLPDLGVELGLISRFLMLHNKPKTYRTVLNVFNAVNRAIQKGHIRKSKRKTDQGELPPSLYHKQIAYIQERLLYVLQKVYKGTDPEEVQISKFSEPVIRKMNGIRQQFERFPSIGYAIRFVEMQGKAPDKQKVGTLLSAIEKAQAAGKIAPDDPNADFIPRLVTALKSYHSGKSKLVSLQSSTLNGIANVLNGCACGDRLDGPAPGKGKGREYFWSFEAEDGEYYALVWDDDGREILEIPNRRTMDSLVEFGRVKADNDQEGLEAHLRATGKIGPKDWISYVGAKGTDRDGLSGLGASAAGEAGPAGPVPDGGDGTGDGSKNPDGASPDGTGGGNPAIPGDPTRSHFIIPPPRGNAVSFSSDNMPPSSGSIYPFAGRWGALLNQPSEGFSAIIYGQPKSGKSTMAADLGGYLARNFGTVLYASIEEGDRATLRQRFERLDVKHPDLHVKNFLPADLRPFDFVIVDSASRGLMEIETLRGLIQQWPKTNFFFLFHVTNQGLPRGGTQYRHEVDVLIEVKEGMAYADGRFGHGEMKIRFE